jgi:hypothetical protein
VVFLPSYFFYILPNLAKYTSGPSPLEQHHKIEKKNTGVKIRLISLKCGKNIRHKKTE